ncbi:MAG: recombination mediator RecR [Bdellovibrionales bacterium]
MLDHIPSFTKLVHELSRLPGIGPKTAGRLAYYILRQPESYARDISCAMQQLHEKIHECPSCYSLTEEDGACHFCTDKMRDDHLVCVVEEPSDIARIESSGVFRGRYHVLHGAISPLDGVGPEDLKISDLIHKVNQGLEGEMAKIEEVILALDADLEGDTTVLYLAKILKEKGVKITRIAHGVPIGGDIDYVDHRTLGRALENRVNI